MLEKLIGGLPTMPQVEAGDLFYLVLRDAEGRRYTLVRHAMRAWTSGNTPLAIRLLESAR